MQTQLAINLKKARTDIGVTQLAIAQALGLDRTAIVKIEAGDRQVTATELCQLATLYETTPNDLLGIQATDESDAIRKTYEHIELVKRLLGSAQIELMRRQFTHDRSKLQEPEWGMFAEKTHQLAGLTYGSDEYKAQLKEMKAGPLAHHYEHNRHHPEYFEPCEPSKEIENHLLMAKWAIDNAQVLPDDIYGYRQLKEFLETKQAEHQSSVNNMTLFDVLEMFVDWAAAVQRHDDGDIHRSIRINTERFGLSPQMVAILTNTVEWIKDEFQELETQKDLIP